MEATPVSAQYYPELDLAITGMTCASCVARVEKKLNKVSGVSASVNLATEQAHIILSEAHSAAELIAVVEKAGYGAQLIESADSSNEQLDNIREHITDLKHRLIVSTVFTIPIIALSMTPAWQFRGWQWLVAALSIPVTLWCGWPFHRGALRAGRHGSFTMDTLICLGVSVSMLWSLWALFFGNAGALGYTMKMGGIHGITASSQNHIYCESAAMIVTFLLFGRWLEARSRHHTGDALQALLHLGAKEAELVSDGESRIVRATDLRVGDVFRVRPGGIVATDAVVIDGNSAINASLVTGESTPIEVIQGSSVIGATINTYGTLLLRATRVGQDTTLSQMGQLLIQAQHGKAPVQRLVDRISSVFVPAVIAIATVTFIVRLFTLHNPTDMALASAITVLVVACPCALGLATPTALLVGTGRLSRLGALIDGIETLETAHRTTTILLDKTGTLTSGSMKVTKIFGNVGETLTIAAGLECYSEHPIAQALSSAAREQGITPGTVESFRTVTGSGVMGLMGESETIVRAGSPQWLMSEGVDLSAIQRDIPDCGPGSIVVVSKNNLAIGAVIVTDPIRDESAEALAQLRQLNIRPILLSGDNREAAMAVARTLGIEEVYASASPAKKLSVVRQLQAKGEVVAMVGDGVNDAGALAAADFSISMGSGTEVAKAAADMTIVNSDMRTIAQALVVSRQTLTVIKQNLIWAFAYNLIAIPLAVCGLIIPGIAAAAMASSSIIVVLNSLRLRHAA